MEILFNLKRFFVKAKVLYSHISEFLYVDDYSLSAHSKEYVQYIMNVISAACTTLGLTISLKKTVIMYQPSTFEHYMEPFVTMYGQRLEVVTKLFRKYFENCWSK